jgi:transcriptional regulator with XRE-family HTH domain
LQKKYRKNIKKMKNSDYERLLLALGQVLTNSRANAQITQEELGEKLNKGQSAVAKIERNPSPNIALRVLYNTAITLNLSLSDIFLEAERLSGLSTTSTKKRQNKNLSSSQKKQITDLVAKNLQKANDNIIRHLCNLTP